MEKRTIARKLDYEAENLWWASFYLNVEGLTWDDSVVLADDLRQQGFTPEETAHRVKAYDQDLF